MGKQIKIREGIAKYRKGWYRTNRWRLCIERIPRLGEIVLRLPFRLGVSFISPWWQIIFGIARNDRGFQWYFLCFSGEVWKDD